MEVPLDENWDVNADALLRAVEMAEPNVLFLASPNNPTGTMVDEAQLERIVQGAPETLVVVDEAYIDYADRDQLSLIERYENVAILRTLSKVGFASLRVGWMVAHKRVIEELDKVRLPYNLPTICQELASVVLSEFSHELEAVSQAVVAERNRVATELARFKGITVVPSQANFLWLEVQRPAGEVFTDLGKKGVLVRSFHGRGGRLENYLRVTIGKQRENDRFLEALQESL